MSDKGGKQDDQEGEKKSSRFTATNVYALFGFLTALIGFLFLVDPALRPDPRENQLASLSIARVDKGITDLDYLMRVGPRATPRIKRLGVKACLPGNVVYIEEQLKGFKHRDLVMRYLTMNATSDQRVQTKIMDISGGVATTLTGEVTSDQGVSMLWVQWPLNPGKYSVRFELFSGGNLITMAQTEPFGVTQQQTKRLEALCNVQFLQLSQHEFVQEPVFSEASFGGGGGVDVGQWLLYAGLAIIAALCGALLYHGVTLLRRRHPQE